MLPCNFFGGVLPQRMLPGETNIALPVTHPPNLLRGPLFRTVVAYLDGCNVGSPRKSISWSWTLAPTYAPGIFIACQNIRAPFRGPVPGPFNVLPDSTLRASRGSKTGLPLCGIRTHMLPAGRVCLFHHRRQIS